MEMDRAPSGVRRHTLPEPGLKAKGFAKRLFRLRGVVDELAANYQATPKEGNLKAR